MKRFEIRLQDDLHYKIKKESFESGKSMHEIIIEIIKGHYKGEKNND